jgi:hypothetical protein
MKRITGLIIVGLAVIGGSGLIGQGRPPMPGGVRKVALIDASAAKQACGSLSKFAIAYVKGNAIVQKGQGHYCQQGKEMNAVGEAFTSDRKVCKLASAAQALQACKTGVLAQDDIAYIEGRNGMAQYGMKYNCKQEAEKGSVGFAICQ